MTCHVVALIALEDGNVAQVGRFANYLRGILPCTDYLVTEMTAKAIGCLALAEGAYTAEYVEFEVRRALEWLSTDKNENKQLAAVSNCNCSFGVFTFQDSQCRC